MLATVLLHQIHKLVNLLGHGRITISFLLLYFHHLLGSSQRSLGSHDVHTNIIDVTVERTKISRSGLNLVGIEHHHLIAVLRLHHAVIATGFQLVSELLALEEVMEHIIMYAEPLLSAIAATQAVAVLSEVVMGEGQLSVITL